MAATTARPAKWRRRNGTAPGLRLSEGDQAKGGARGWNPTGRWQRHAALAVASATVAGSYRTGIWGSGDGSVDGGSSGRLDSLSAASAPRAAFFCFPGSPRRDGPSETSMVEALNAEPDVLAIGEPSGSTAWVKIVAIDSHNHAR